MTYDSLDVSVTNIDKLRRAIILWDEISRVPYFEYRRQLKEITVNSCAYQIVSDPLCIGDDDWLIPSDDDDWLGSLDEITCADSDFVHWQSLVANTVKGCSYSITGSFDRHPESNGYAIKGKYLKSLEGWSRDKLIQCHQKTFKYAGSRMFLPKVLSAYNQHPGCSHILKSAKTKEDILRSFPTKVCLPLFWPEYYASICAMARLVTTVLPCLGGT